MKTIIRIDRGALLSGLLATFGLLGGYLVIVSALSGSFSYGWSQFQEFGYWLTSLALGFGVQVSLFLELKRMHQTGNGGAVVMTGTTSGAAMLSCCAHYLVNLVPLLGVSAFSIFIGRYQTEIFVFGLLANLAGIVYLGRKLNLHQCPTP